MQFYTLENMFFLLFYVDSIHLCYVSRFSDLLCFQVSAVPTVIAMRGGDVIDRFVGIKDDIQLDSFVSKVIGQ